VLGEFVKWVVDGSASIAIVLAVELMQQHFRRGGDGTVTKVYCTLGVIDSATLLSSCNDSSRGVAWDGSGNRHTIQ
jgi:hypothetical protein